MVTDRWAARYAVAEVLADPGALPEVLLDQAFEDPVGH